MTQELTLARAVAKKARAFALAIGLTESNRQINQANTLQVEHCLEWPEMKIDAL